MNTRHVIGRRIVAVRHEHVQTLSGQTHRMVACIELDNGVRLISTAYETEIGAPVGDILLHDTNRKRRTPRP